MPKIVDHAAYRAELLDGSVDLFARHGYSGLSMRQIAGDLKVSTGTLYHYFDSKQDLFLQAVEHLTDRLAEVVRQASQGATPRTRLQGLLDHAAAHEDWFAAYNRLCLDYLRERSERGAKVMASSMRHSEAVLAETLEIDEPAARFILISLFGLVTERDLDGGATGFSEQAALLLEWFDGHQSAHG